MPQYPGLGLDLRYLNQGGQQCDLYPIGIHANCYGSQSEMLLVREVAMMIVMDQLTDKHNFHIKVFDKAITSKWIDEALAIPNDYLYDQIVKGKKGGHVRYPKKLGAILDRECLEYCIQELQIKAAFYEKTGLIPTLDASASVVKSDCLVDVKLHDSLSSAFVKLKADQQSCPDWHPGTNCTVQDLVHPSLYPLVYGKTRAFTDELVGVEDAISKWAGRGTAVPYFGSDEPSTNLRRTVSIGSSNIEKSFWSDNYQWLPSNVKLQDDGSVRFTSYINNLHPVKHREVYKTIERLIEKSLPAWNTCLTQYRDYQQLGGARTEPRFPRPINPDDENEENWTPRLEDFEISREALETAINEERSQCSVSGSDSSESEEEDYEEGWDENGDWHSGTRKEVEWEKIREPVQPAPPKFEAWEYGVKPGESLQERFDSLQFIVKMASIELTPENPEFPLGGWHVEGQMNEHIIATALYYLDSENITTSHLEFRMQTSLYQDDWDVGQDAYSWMEQVYGTRLGSGSSGPCLQNYGAVETKPGRLLAFPNLFHHRVSPFELKDKTKPGHRRFIAIWLVDPHTRIISTANVPPQQQSWWMDDTFGSLKANNAHKIPGTIAQLILEKVPQHMGLAEAVKQGQQLPEELTDVIRKDLRDALLMTQEEANEHRLALMAERSNTDDQVRDSWLRVDYSFCEH